MKQLIKLFFAPAIWLSSSLVAPAQSPCLRVNGDLSLPCPNDATISRPTNVTSNQVSFQVKDAEGTLHNLEHGARYKAFWVFGDGSFRHFDYGDMAQDLATYNRTYVYPNQGIYNPMVVLSERKSNDSPPRTLQRSINIENRNVAPGTEDAFNARILGNKSMDIFNHDRNRPHYPTVFAVSSLSGDKLIDSVYFFYNGERRADGTFAAKKIHDFGFVNFPNYFSPEPTAAEQLVSGLQGCLNIPAVRNVLDARFFNFVSVGLFTDGFVVDRNAKSTRTARSLRVEGPLNPFPETRFFPSLTSIWEPRWITPGGDTLLPKGHYLSLAVGSEPLPPRNPNNPNEANPIITEVLGYFPSLDAQLQIGQNKYIRGIDVAEVEMVASIDPNGLQVLEVCPDGPNRYKVKIRMEVCNEGYMHEQNFGFRLIDHTGLISEPEFIAGTLPSLLSSSANEWAYKWNVFLDAVPLPEETSRSMAEARKMCDTLIFTVTTNWLGVQRLSRGEGLELCVKFDHANEECHLNYALDEQKVSPLTGFECGDAPTSCWVCCLPVYLTLFLAIVILVLLIWIAWFLRKKLG